ncbi:eukaryotic translation initiation factor-like protein 2C 2 [Mollisia scopiformis]|uniref:Eukaryotic translation initiation factor-like protein 2C 2 n=1 Tax=Mollisia scopiformis TaxID=149040 RepID=A0A194WSY5_MOLSC|nr:eukaryotic translation initiation factor-like protein 2C 2 [Mollisia scopiformis]KUJ10732.1 eukaryotic translation initiation factor-like protein 2C 2 [Mollisia scopiformis]
MERESLRIFDRETNNWKDNYPTELPARPGWNDKGKAISIRVNQYKVVAWPDKDVQQYDINIGTGAEKRGKIMAVWKSRAVQSVITRNNTMWLWDGMKIAWTSARMPEQRIMVNFDEEKGRAPRDPNNPDTCLCVIKPSKTIRMAVIEAYLAEKIPFDSSILEAINFLDHLMRQGPSELYTQIKRSFFARGGNTVSLDNCVVAMKGVYSSIRLCNPKSAGGNPTAGLAVNVDVANGTFWAAQDVHQAARNFLKERNRASNWDVFRQNLRPIKDGKGGWTWSEDLKLLRKMAKLKFTVKHRGKQDDLKQYSIKRFTFLPRQDGGHSKNTYFKLKNRQTGSEEEISVFDYFRKTYNITINMWDIPLIETDKAGLFPMELCTLVPNQRYNFKLSPDQTAAMIKFAVTRPKERIASIQHGIGMLRWNEDKYLRHYGVKIDSNMTLTNARLLQPPEVQYQGSKANPGTSGRWDLRGKRFLLANEEPLNSWGICIVNDCLPEAAVRNFMNVFIQTYIGHGGKVQNKTPFIYRHAKTEDLSAMVPNFRTATGNQVKAMPQILFYVMPGRDSWMYERLKRNNECRFAMVSQCVNIAHVQKAQPQYCSNVCMKVNAKLGGTSCKVAATGNPFKVPTMIIGADVSHASPGSVQASMAAITVSMDQICCRFAAAVQTNGHRVEMITKNNISTMLMPLIKQWQNNAKIGGGRIPQHIYYFRDGVSEGQYAQVLNQEVKHMKECMIETFGAEAANVKWTVAVCTKRHHIRFFPKDGDSQAADRNGNPLPGTLVERDVTHPFEYDFYLSAHSAIQGTARPVHYQVLLDEAKVNVNDFQKMIYTFSYQYMRSTTPVSIFPAIYYAHLASNRARAHESKPASAGPGGGQKFDEARQDAAVAANRERRTQQGTSQTGSSAAVEVLPLVPLGNPESGNIAKIRTGMWYI